MRTEYDVSNAVKNPCASQLKMQITIRLDSLGQPKHRLLQSEISEQKAQEIPDPHSTRFKNNRPGDLG
jgi:hypothetical protein